MRALSVLLAGLALLLALPAGAKTLVFCSEGNPEAINPQLAVTGTAMDASWPMFNTLVEFAPGSTQLVPALAESWTISPDGREYVFKLRPGVKFHSSPRFRPTRNLEADDVAFSLMRQWKPDHPFHNVGGGHFDYFQDMGMPTLLESIEVVDKMTVRIRLTRPEAPFLADLALPFNAILSAEYADTLMKAGTPELLDTAPVGTGPFSFDSFRKDVVIRYRAFDDYWRGRPAIDTLVFSITPTSAARLTKLKAGECHVMAYPSPDDVKSIEADPRLELRKQQGFNIGYLALNTTRPPFDDVRVRRAINMAIDKGSILSAIYDGTGAPAVNPMPPTLWAYNHFLPQFEYDPEKARQLFVEAGLTAGMTVDLWYMPVNRPYNPNGKRMAEMIADDLAKLGIRLELKTAEWNEYREKLQNGVPTMALYGWTGDNGDPDNFMHTLLSCTAARIGGNNIARWCDKGFDALVTEAKETSDQQQRKKLYDEAQKIFHDQVPWVPIAHSVFMVAMRKEVKNFVMDPLGYHKFEGVDLDERPR